MVAAFIPYGVHYDLSIACWYCCHHGLWASTLRLRHHLTCGCFSALLQRRYCIIIKVNESVWGSTSGGWWLAGQSMGLLTVVNLGNVLLKMKPMVSADFTDRDKLLKIPFVLRYDQKSWRESDSEYLGRRYSSHIRITIHVLWWIWKIKFSRRIAFQFSYASLTATSRW